MSEFEIHRQPKFHPDNLTHALRALKKGNSDVTIGFLKYRPEAEGSNEAYVLNTIHRSFMLSEALSARSTLRSMREATTEYRSALNLVDKLPPTIRQTYEAVLLCSAAEIERVANISLSKIEIDGLQEVVGELDDDNPVKDLLTYYSQRTIGLAQMDNPQVASEHLALAKDAHTAHNGRSKNQIPRDGILEVDVTDIKLNIARIATPYPLSTLFAFTSPEQAR